MKKMNQKGFTLIELMIVVAIIGILAAVAIPQYQNFTKKSKSSEAKVILDSIITAQAAYYAEQDVTTLSLTNLGNPDKSAKYYNYVLVRATGVTTNISIEAQPHVTFGKNAGLVSTWSMTYSGTTGEKTYTYPAQGF